MSTIYADNFSNRSGSFSVQTENIETRSTPGTKNVSEIFGGILELTPEDGRYITLEGHGTDDYIVEGFGTQCPVGWVATIVIPRTIGNTGGAVNELGNYVQFIHATSGAGLDNEKVKIMDGSTAFRGYRAYPNATDATGNAAALFEELTYQHIGSGRWVLRDVPASAHGSSASGNWIRDAIGTQKAWAAGLGPLDVNLASGNVWRSATPSEWSYPVKFLEGVHVSPGQDGGTVRWLAAASTGAATEAAAFSMFGPTQSATTTPFSASVEGRWKPLI